MEIRCSIHSYQLMVYKNIDDVLLKAQNVLFCVGQNFHEQITKGMFLAKYMSLKVLV